MRLLRIVLFTALLFGAASISAQTQKGDLVAEIPFTFVVAGTALPPGHYIVKTLDDNLGIHDRENRGVFVAAHSAQRPERDNSSKMVFHRYGDTYFLSEVWVGGNSIGRELFTSRAEKQLSESGKEREIAVVRMRR
jgi:hypothetical protein